MSKDTIQVVQATEQDIVSRESLWDPAIAAQRSCLSAGYPQAHYGARSLRKGARCGDCHS